MTKVIMDTIMETHPMIHNMQHGTKKQEN
jgi:hypothetical protein